MDVRELARRGPLLVRPRSVVVPVGHEDGGIGGTQTMHWDGRIDANVFARPVRIRMRADQRDAFMRSLRMEP